MGEKMLKVEELTKEYGKLKACDDISFELDEGSITVLLGPNGAGKSTLMKSIMGLLKFQGHITINGLENNDEAARSMTGYIPELPALYPNLTVLEHMEFLARVYKLENYKDRISYLLNRFEMMDKRRKFGDELSKGMQQKLNLCLGFLPEPRFILLDEPMIGLDPHAIKELKEILIELKNEGCTILISTHIIDSVDMLWDRALIMQAGKIKANILKTELDESGQTLEELFFTVTEGLDKDMGKESEEDA